MGNPSASPWAPTSLRSQYLPGQRACRLLVRITKKVSSPPTRLFKFTKSILILENSRHLNTIYQKPVIVNLKSQHVHKMNGGTELRSVQPA